MTDSPRYSPVGDTSDPFEGDARLRELTERARVALEELAAHLAARALDAGAVLPDDLRAFLEKRPGGPAT